MNETRGVLIWHINLQSDDAFNQYQRNGCANGKNRQGKDGKAHVGAVELSLGIGVSIVCHDRFHRRYGLLASG